MTFQSVRATSVADAKSVCNAVEQNLQMFVIMVYVYAVQDTSKWTENATKVNI